MTWREGCRTSMGGAGLEGRGAGVAWGVQDLQGGMKD